MELRVAYKRQAKPELSLLFLLGLFNPVELKRSQIYQEAEDIYDYNALKNFIRIRVMF